MRTGAHVCSRGGKKSTSSPNTLENDKNRRLKIARLPYLVSNPAPAGWMATGNMDFTHAIGGEVGHESPGWRRPPVQTCNVSSLEPTDVAGASFSQYLVSAGGTGVSKRRFLVLQPKGVTFDVHLQKEPSQGLPLFRLLVINQSGAFQAVAPTR